MRTLLTFLGMWFLLLPCLADGKFYGLDPVPPDIPYQRAIIFYQDGRETLVLQSKLDPKTKRPSFGWVVPVPSVPDLATMPAADAEWIFGHLSGETGAKEIYLSNMVIPAVARGLVWAVVVTSLLFLLSFVIPRLKKTRRPREVLVRFGAYWVAFSILAAVLELLQISTRAEASFRAGVEVVKSERVGIYDMKVIRGQDGQELVAWLNANGFKFAPADTAVVDRYAKSGWCFVVAKIHAVKDLESNVESGLVDPLILRFRADSPVYPLALTATVGNDTEVLIYVAADHRMDCDERMKLRFAGYPLPTLNLLSPSGDKPFLRWEESLAHFSKFTGTLTPEQMQEDLKFVQAKDDKPFRERHVHW